MRKDTLSASEARRIALSAQGFSRRRPQTSAPRHLRAEIERMGVLQIDSVNVFARSHYLPLFSRLGRYEPTALDRLLLAPRRVGSPPPFVEYVAHEATFLPTEDWPLWGFRRDDMRSRYAKEGSWFAENRATVEWVLAELAERGPLRAGEIERDAARTARGTWWDWDEVKRALEYLWRFGDVAIAGRIGFERRYGLTADVVPHRLLDTDVARPAAVRELVGRAAAAFGVATAADLADYYRLRDRGSVQRAIDELVESGELVPVTVRGWQRAGRPLPAWRHRDAALPRRIDRATLLSPFDPVVWFRERSERLFGFTYRIEIYTPAERRRFGYYSLPLLVGDRIVGRIDLKADRRSSTLLVQSAWWEGGVDGAALAPAAAEAIAEAGRWQGLDDVSVARWGDATDHIARAIGAGRHGADVTSADSSAATS